MSIPPLYKVLNYNTDEISSTPCDENTGYSEVTAWHGEKDTTTTTEEFKRFIENFNPNDMKSIVGAAQSTVDVKEISNSGNMTTNPVLVSEMPKDVADIKVMPNKTSVSTEVEPTEVEPTKVESKKFTPVEIVGILFFVIFLVGGLSWLAWWGWRRGV